MESWICVEERHEGPDRWLYYAMGTCLPVGSPLASQIHGALEARRYAVEHLTWVARLFSESQQRNTGPEGPDTLAVRQDFRSALLSEPRFLNLVMADVHSALTSQGLACADCPGPREPSAARGVTLDDLMPYVIAYVWPTSAAQLKVCAGKNGVHLLEDPDPLLVEAGFQLLLENQDAMNAIANVMGMAHGLEAFRALQGDEQQASFLREHFSRELPRAAGFRQAMARHALTRLPPLGVVCSDCDAVLPAPESDVSPDSKEEP